jgi:hypothetical protein
MPSLRALRLSDDELTAVYAAARPLEVSARDGFLQAVADALQSCAEIGPGVVHRIIAATQRDFFNPPPDRQASVGVRHRATKLSGGPPIGADDPRCGGRDRRRLRPVV